MILNSKWYDLWYLKILKHNIIIKLYLKKMYKTLFTTPTYLSWINEVLIESKFRFYSFNVHGFPISKYTAVIKVSK